MPPIFQPELAARAIVFLAEHPRRNMWVGIATAYTILGERLAPKLLDLYLGETGVKSQQTDQDAPRLGSNVFEPQDHKQDRAVLLSGAAGLSALAGAAWTLARR